MKDSYTPKHLVLETQLFILTGSKREAELGGHKVDKRGQHL